MRSRAKSCYGKCSGSMSGSDAGNVNFDIGRFRKDVQYMQNNMSLYKHCLEDKKLENMKRFNDKIEL